MTMSKELRVIADFYEFMLWMEQSLLEIPTKT